MQSHEIEALEQSFGLDNYGTWQENEGTPEEPVMVEKSALTFKPTQRQLDAMIAAAGGSTAVEPQE